VNSCPVARIGGPAGLLTDDQVSFFPGVSGPELIDL
jgi:hypothetical protein